MSEIKHDRTREIVCPYCGWEESGSWEIDPGEEDLGVIECGYCWKQFDAIRNVSVTYTTLKIEKGLVKERRWK